MAAADLTALAVLDQAHRNAQAQNNMRLAQAIIAYWLLVRGDNLAETGAAWLEKAIPAVVGAQRRSALLSLSYAERIRRVHFPAERAPARPPVPEPNLEQIRGALTAVGLKQAARTLAKLPTKAAEPTVYSGDVADQADLVIAAARGSRDFAQAIAATERTMEQRKLVVVRNAGVAAAASAIRLANNGGRQAAMDVVSKDPRARGWVRVTRENPCYLCALLAARGPVYERDSFEASNRRFLNGKVPSDQKVHDSCVCQLRPVYSKSMEEWPKASLRFDEIYRQAQLRPDVPGAKNDLMTKFRRLYEGRAPSAA